MLFSHVHSGHIPSESSLWQASKQTQKGRLSMKEKKYECHMCSRYSSESVCWPYVNKYELYFSFCTWWALATCPLQHDFLDFLDIPMPMGACVRSTLITRKSRRNFVAHQRHEPPLERTVIQRALFFRRPCSASSKKKHKAPIVGRKFMQNCTIVFAAILSTEDYLYAPLGSAFYFGRFPVCLCLHNCMYIILRWCRIVSGGLCSASMRKGDSVESNEFHLSFLTSFFFAMQQKWTEMSRTAMPSIRLALISSN